MRWEAAVDPRERRRSQLVLGGLGRPNPGTCRLAVEDVTALPPDALLARRDRIGFVFPSFDLLPGASAQANAALPRRCAGVSCADRMARAARVVTHAGWSRADGRAARMRRSRAAPCQLQAALPPGLRGLFALGPTIGAPLVVPPFRVYIDPDAAVVVPGAYRLQQSFQFVIPKSPALVGADVTVQCLVVSDPGVQAPPLALPPGRRFVMQ